MSDYRDRLYYQLLDKRVLTVDEDVDEDIISKVGLQIVRFNLEDDEKEKESKTYKREEHPIKVYINTCGGYVWEAFGLVGIIEKSKTPVHTIALGKALSAGFIILLSGHERQCYPYTTIMIHDESYGIHGMPEDHRTRLEWEDKFCKMSKDYILLRSRIDESDYDNMIKTKKNWWIGAEEALSMGIVERII